MINVAPSLVISAVQSSRNPANNRVLIAPWRRRRLQALPEGRVYTAFIGHIQGENGHVDATSRL
jgi:hypothetical protein